MEVSIIQANMAGPGMAECGVAFSTQFSTFILEQGR